jgi:starvation-inducible DNA-binding protein
LPAKIETFFFRRNQEEVKDFMANNSGTETTAMPINIGIEGKDRQEIADGLSKLLADTFTLYLKTHNFHWNVTGPMFRTLHIMFEEQYNELWTATDLIAERIRALGVYAPATFKEFTKLATIKEEDGVPAATDMIRSLVEGHEAAARTARTAFSVAEGADDAPTADLLTERMQVHEKTAWMLRSLLADEGSTAAAQTA